MHKPAVPVDETVRLRSLQSLRVLDTEPEERFDRITRLASRVFNVPTALVSLVDQNRQWFKSRQGLDACETNREISFCGHAILNERTFVVQDAEKDPRFADNPLVVADPRIRFYAGHPVHGTDGSRIGTLCVIDTQPRRFSDADAATLAAFAAMVDREFSLLAETTTDELTRISNRRGFMQIAEHVLALCRRNRQPAVVIAIDLDGFKQINDRAGHAAGDTVLRQFARLLLKHFRDSDVVARLGGDEFCVLASGTTEREIHASLERLEHQFESSELATQHPGLGWSCGVAQIDPRSSPRDINEVLRDADGRMYDTKTARKLRRAASGNQ